MRGFYIGVFGMCVVLTCLVPRGAQESQAGAQAKQGANTEPDKSRVEKLMEGSRSRVYKTVDKTELRLHIFQPPGFQPSDQRPAIVFFFGGGWASGAPTQFAPHCRYLASRGMVAITAEYRVRSRNQSTVEQSTADAKSAIRWVRAHARELGIARERIAAGGGSAGGHLAATTATLQRPDEAGEDKNVSALPNALVLFNPVLDLKSFAEQKGTAKREVASRFGRDPQDLSPAHHVQAGQPPAIIFHGTADKTVPFESAQKFRDAYVTAGNLAELVAYEGEGHGFFNWNRDEKNFLATLTKTDEFLASLGWIEGEPNVQGFFQSQSLK